MALPGQFEIGSNTAHHRLFSVCANKQMVILSSEDGRVVATLPIDEGPDGATFDLQSATECA